MNKSDLEPAFEAWYDFKMEPEDIDLLKQHRLTMDRLAEQVSEQAGQSIDRYDLMRALRVRFGQWMKEKGLPKPPKK